MRVKCLASYQRFISIISLVNKNVNATKVFVSTLCELGTMHPVLFSVSCTSISSHVDIGHDLVTMGTTVTVEEMNIHEHSTTTNMIDGVPYYSCSCVVHWRVHNGKSSSGTV